MERLFDQRRYLIPFRSSLLPQIFTDVLVIGGGVAGLRAGIAAAQAGSEAIVLFKGEAYDSNTAWAQGGIAVSGMEGERGAGEKDVEAHIADTLECGSGLCDEPIVQLIIRHGATRVAECLSWGLDLDRDTKGSLELGLEGGHSASRILHSHGDATGREFQRCLLERVRSTQGVRLFDRCFALDLITPSPEVGAPVMGAITHHPKHGLQMIWARTTILASGGAGQVYRETSNPRVATGDGEAMAYRAGATLSDMAFMQFHPTTLYLPGAPRSLVSEAVRGEGALLLNMTHRRFMRDVHPMAELAPRDVVSRAIVDEISKQGGRHVWLDCRGIARFAQRFPSIHAELKRFDLDPSRDLIPVHPAAHYMVGGVRTDASGWTDLPGLMAAGEAACSGIHGANRLASNSLLEGLVMGEIAGRIAGEGKPAGDGRRGPVSIVSDIRPSDQGELDLNDVRSSLRSAMWRNVGIERTGNKLRDAVSMFDFWGRYTLDKIFDEPMGWETQNLLLLGAIMARSALWREESRGCHARGDFPLPREEFLVHDCWRRGRETPKSSALLRPVGAT
jgi:L-aspartate oxidase